MTAAVPAPMELPDLVDVALEPGGEALRGRVIDTNGEPVGFARVFFLQAQPFMELEQWARFFTSDAVSADDGFFELPAPAFEGPRMIQATRFDGRVSDLTPLESASSPLDLVLQPGCTLSGRILLPEGADANQLQVLVSRSDIKHQPVVQSNVAEDGSFRLEGMVDANDVQVAPWDLPSDLFVVWAEVELMSGEPVVIVTARPSRSPTWLEGSM